MTEEEHLKKQLHELQSESNKKDEEIAKLLDKVESLEEEIIRYEEDVEGKVSNKKSKKSKLEIELDAKEKEIRELKDRMGFLRKEKMDYQKELEEIKQKNATTSVISVEELREKNKPPLNALLQDLQDKIKKQDALIRKLKSQNDGQEFSIQLKEKDEKIELLNEKVEALTQQVENASSKTTIIDTQTSEPIQKKLLTDLQEKLNKTKFRNEELKKELDEYKKKVKGEDTSEINELKGRVTKLTTELEQKENEINNLKELNSTTVDLTVNAPLDKVVEELKNKLNKSRNQINTLQEQLKAIQIQSDSVEISGDNSGRLKIQREMASFLQKQLDEAKSALKTKEEEIAAIKNEAIRIKRKYEDLENLVKQKESNIKGIQTESDSYRIKTPAPSSSNQVLDPGTDLRIRELESFVEDLTKQNIQQRIEISELRKK
jgi:chromosome segregation ATPase